MRGKPKLIQRNDSDSWFIYIPKKGARRAQRLTTGTEDYSEAEQIFGQWLIERKKPELTDADEIKVLDMLVRYEEYKKNDATVGYHMRRLKPWFKDVMYSQVNNPLIREYVAFRTGQKIVIGKGHGKKTVSPATVRRELDTLIASFGRYRKDGLVKDVPVLERPDASIPRKRWLSEEEFGRQYAAAHKNKDLLDFLDLMINTEARPCFIYPLMWEQCNFEERKIDFNPPGRRQNNKVRPAIAMNDIVYQVLQRRLKDSESPYVFPGRKKGQHIKSFKKGFKKAAQDAGLKDVIPYTLRHTSITWAVKAGHGLAHAGQMAGHRDPRTTMGYAHHDPRFTADVAATLATGAQLAHKFAESIIKEQSAPENKDKNQ